MAKKHPTEPQRETRKLADLRPFPGQSLYYPRLPEHELRALAKDIEVNKLKQPLEILPKNTAGYEENTVLDGHQRWAALELLRESDAPVVVRYDLASATPEIVEKVFLQSNTPRRHQDPLGRARVALRCFEIERKRPKGGLREWDEKEARDRVGKVINMTGRNLSRYFRVLRTPVEVQDAFRAGKLTLVVAEKVADLNPKQQDEIAAKISSGAPAGEVVRDYLPQKPAKKSVPNHLGQVVTTLEAARSALADTGALTSPCMEIDIDALRLGQEFLAGVIARIDCNRQRAAAALRKQFHEEEEE